MWSGRTLVGEGGGQWWTFRGGEEYMYLDSGEGEGGD